MSNETFGQGGSGLPKDARTRTNLPDIIDRVLWFVWDRADLLGIVALTVSMWRLRSRPGVPRHLTFAWLTWFARSWPAITLHVLLGIFGALLFAVVFEINNYLQHRKRSDASFRWFSLVLAENAHLFPLAISSAFITAWMGLH